MTDTYDQLKYYILARSYLHRIDIFHTSYSITASNTTVLVRWVRIIFQDIAVNEITTSMSDINKIMIVCWDNLFSIWFVDIYSPVFM